MYYDTEVRDYRETKLDCSEQGVYMVNEELGVVIVSIRTSVLPHNF
jgi:hypothetical protein